MWCGQPALSSSSHLEALPVEANNSKATLRPSCVCLRIVLQLNSPIKRWLSRLIPWPDHRPSIVCYPNHERHCSPVHSETHMPHTDTNICRDSDDWLPPGARAANLKCTAVTHALLNIIPASLLFTFVIRDMSILSTCDSYTRILSLSSFSASLVPAAYATGRP